MILIAETGSVKVVWDNRLALKDSWVQFECLTAGWYPAPTVQWQVKEKEVSAHILLTMTIFRTEELMFYYKTLIKLKVYPPYIVVNAFHCNRQNHFLFKYPWEKSLMEHLYSHCL